MEPLEQKQIETLSHRLMGNPEWRRLKMILQACPHDADREIVVKLIRSILMTSLTEFRRKAV